MADNYYGMRGVSQWGTDARPKSIREGIRFVDPNGNVPLTGFTAMLKSKALDDMEFKWFTRVLASRSGTVTAIYTNAAMTTLYTSGGVAGTVLYVKIPDASGGEFIAGRQALLRDASNLDVDCNVKVTEVTRSYGGTAFTRLKVTLLEADNGSVDNDLSDADVIILLSNINSVGSDTPTALHKDAVERDNYMQIFKTAADMAFETINTKYRYAKDPWAACKRDALIDHGLDIELAFLLSVKSLNIGENGKEEYTGDGLITVIKTLMAGNCAKFAAEAAAPYLNSYFYESGVEWMDEKLATIFAYGGSNRMALCGIGALNLIQRVIRANSAYNISFGEKVFGLSVMRWHTPFGDVALKVHPIFSRIASQTYRICIFEPEEMKYVYLQNSDTKFRDLATTRTAKLGEYYTVCGLDFGSIEGAGILDLAVKNGTPV